MPRPRMNPAQFADFQQLNAQVARGVPVVQGNGHSLTPSEMQRWADLRDNYVLPPQLPAAGSPCTYSIGSDSYAGTVFLVGAGGRDIWADLGCLGVEKFTYRGDGAYRLKGQTCGRLYLGYAESYRDPGF